MNKTKENDNIIWRLVGGAFVVAQAIVSVLLIISLVKMNILNGLIITLICIVLVALLALNIYKLLFQKTSTIVARSICMVLSAIVVAGGIFALRYTDAFNGFLNKITELKPEMKSYSVVVNEDSGIEELSGLKDKSVGFLKTDNKAKNAEQHLQGSVAILAEYYDDVDVLVGMLNTDIIDAIVLESDRIEMIKEDNEESMEKTKIIYTFEIELEGETVVASIKEVTKEPFIVYISGSDSRYGVKATARSDVNIVVVVNPSNGKILLASIPRDTYVQLHDTTGLKDKLTHAGVYGVNMSKTTIEDFLGIKIDHTIKVSFETVVKVVDELDGIDIESDQELTLKTNGKVCNFIVGKQHVDGDCALRFARERKSYTTGDRHRGENQQTVITSIINKLSNSRDYLLKLPTILDIASDSFETSFTSEEITSFIRLQLGEGIKWQVESIAVDGTGSMLPTYSMGANRPLYVMIPNDASVLNVKNKINEYLSSESVDDSNEEVKDAENIEELD